jgi:type IV secretory pathway TrbF-like protein
MHLSNNEALVQQKRQRGYMFKNKSKSSDILTITDHGLDDGYVEVSPILEPQSKPAKRPAKSQDRTPIKFPEITKAGERYIEQYGEPLVTNTYLKVAVLLLCLVILAQQVVIGRSNKALAEKKPIFIRLDEVGHAESIDYRNFTYKPKEVENKFYLTQWAKLYFQRNRFTIESDQTDALFFFDSATSRVVIEAERKEKYIEAYQTNTALPYVEVKVTNIILGDLSSPPYSAQIEFLKIYKDPNSNTEMKRERWTASLNYVFRDNVPNDMVAINPLGMAIVHFRVDQAFNVQTTQGNAR